MIKRGLISAAILVTVSILVIEHRKSNWSRAGGEIHGAASAVGRAISESPAESWDAAKRASERAWEQTREKSKDTWDKARKGIGKGLEHSGEKRPG